MATPPPGPAAGARNDVEEKFRLAREVIGALDRALRTRRMYQPDHQIYQENTQEVLTRMIEFFDHYAYLRLEITPTELRIEGRMVVQALARPNELPFRLYKDGIREIRFHRGLTREEIMDFVNIMELSGEEMTQISEDYVSLLWSKDFKSIDYLAVDEFELAAGEAPLGLDAQQARIAMQVTKRVDETVRRIAARDLDREAGERHAAYGQGLAEEALAFPREGMEEEDEAGVLGSIVPITAAAEAPRESPEGPSLSTLRIDEIVLDPQEEVRATMRSEVENETIGGAIRRSIDILAKLGPAVEIAPLLSGVVDFYVAKGDFGSLGHLMSHLHETHAMETIAGGADLWARLVDRIRKPEPRKALVAYLNRLYGDDTGLQRYFKVVGPSLIRMCCQVYPHIQNARGRQSLRAYFTDFGVAEPGAFKELMAAAGEKHLAEFFEILRDVHPAGVSLDLETYLHSESPSMRRQAILAAARREGNARVQALMRALADPDSAVRAHTLMVIGNTRDAAFRVALQEWCDKADFINRDWSEKELALRALAKVAGAGAWPYLKGAALRVPPLLHRAKGIETRHAAVMALTEFDAHEAAEFLKRWSEGPDEQLAGFAREALEAKGKPSNG